MSTPLKNVPIEWETPDEHEMIHDALSAIDFEKAMWGQVKRSDETRKVMTLRWIYGHISYLRTSVGSHPPGRYVPFCLRTRVHSD